MFFCLISFIYFKFPKTNLKIKLSIKQSSFLATAHILRPLYLLESCMLNPSDFAVLPSTFSGFLFFTEGTNPSYFLLFTSNSINQSQRLNFHSRETLKSNFQKFLNVLEKSLSVIRPWNWIYILRWKKEVLLKILLSYFFAKHLKDPSESTKFLLNFLKRIDSFRVVTKKRKFINCCRKQNKTPELPSFHQVGTLPNAYLHCC